jgi:phage/plasmid-like protein (TIGR03299 family)
MAHDINKMIYVGEVPWHGLGVRLPARATYDEIVEAAGFYEAVERQVFIPPFNAPIPDRKALVRSDTGAYLSVVGKSYEVVQFADVARTLVEAAGDVKAVFTTAGTLGPVGIRGWLLGELPEPIKVRGDESVIRKYVLGCAGHDGYTAVVIKNVATRVVCANTLGVALGERVGASWRIQHTASAKERLEEAGKAFRRIAQSYETFGELANVMAMTRFTSKQMQATIDGILPVPPDDRDHRRLLQEREKVQRLYETAVGVEKLRGTAWGAFQSWTEYADHHRALRDTGRQDPKRARLESIWMGRSAAMKQAALTAIAFHTGIQLAAA